MVCCEHACVFPPFPTVASLPHSLTHSHILSHSFPLPLRRTHASPPPYTYIHTQLSQPLVSPSAQRRRGRSKTQSKHRSSTLPTSRANSKRFLFCSSLCCGLCVVFVFFSIAWSCGCGGGGGCVRADHHIPDSVRVCALCPQVSEEKQEEADRFEATIATLKEEVRPCVASKSWPSS